MLLQPVGLERPTLPQRAKSTALRYLIKLKMLSLRRRRRRRVAWFELDNSDPHRMAGAPATGFETPTRPSSPRRKKRWPWWVRMPCLALCMLTTGLLLYVIIIVVDVLAGPHMCDFSEDIGMPRWGPNP